MITGINELLDGLKNLVPAGTEIQAAFKPIADEIILDIKAQIPVFSGKLRDSYQLVRRRKSNGLTIGAKYGAGGGNHAHLIEDGFTHRSGKKISGHHIEQKVFDEQKTRALDAMEKNLGDVVEKKWNKS
jgi:hypothetical protein